MRQHPLRVDDRLHDLCNDIHDEASSVFGRGCADWPIDSIDPDYLALVRRAESLGYISIEERMDFGDERLVLRLTSSGMRLLKVPENQRRPSIIERIVSFIRG